MTSFATAGAGPRAPTNLAPGVQGNRRGTFSGLSNLLRSTSIETGITFTGTGSNTVLDITGSGIFQFGCLTTTSGTGSTGTAIVTIDGIEVSNDTALIYFNEGLLAAGNISTFAPANTIFEAIPFNKSLKIVCSNSDGDSTYAAKYYLT